MSRGLRSNRNLDKNRRRLGRGGDKKMGKIVTPSGVGSSNDEHRTEQSPIVDENKKNDSSNIEDDRAWLAYWSNEELLGRYKPIRELGRGSYGVVYEAESLWKDEKLGINIGTKVALKKIRRLWKTDTDAKRLLRELRILRKLHGHKCIVRLFDILPPTDSNNFKDITLVFEFVDADLAKIFKTFQFFSSLHVEYMLYHLLLGLKYMHSASISHRDLKPANVLINADCTIKICDFGLARHYTDNDDTFNDPLKKPNESDESDEEKNHKRKSRKKPIKRGVTAHVVTRWYRSPEVIILNQKEKYLPAVDMWSVGCIFAELMQMIKSNCSCVASRGPLFPGDSCFPLSPKKMRNGSGVSQSTYDQILVIFDILGKPSDTEIMMLTDDEQAQKYLIESKPHDSHHSASNRHQKRHARHKEKHARKNKMNHSMIHDVDDNGNNTNNNGNLNGSDEKEELNANGLRGGIDFEDMFPGSSANAMDLLRKLLAFKVEDRITVYDAISHQLFDRVRDKEAEKVLCNKQVDFDFETVRLERNELRSLILSEVVYYNPQEIDRFKRDGALFPVDF